MTNKHTSIPWKLQMEENNIEYVITANIYDVALCFDGADGVAAYDNAKFIVRACNAHDDLVAACKEALECATVPVPFSKQAAKSQHVIKMLSNALKKAGDSL